MMLMKELIENVLKIPVIDSFNPVLPPCATYYLATEESGLTGDKNETETIETYQIDIWDRNREEIKGRARKLKSELISLIYSATIPDISFSYDNNGKTWRATLIFSMVREE